jgi:hypothetical protein
MASTLARLKSFGFLPVWTFKTRLFSALVDNEEALLHHIVDAFRIIRNSASIFERTRLSMMRRVEACIESHGGHFENLL